MAFLRANNGTNIGKEYELISDETLLGRHPSCEVVVQDSAVSRRHAKIEVENDSFFITEWRNRRQSSAAKPRRRDPGLRHRLFVLRKSGSDGAC